MLVLPFDLMSHYLRCIRLLKAYRPAEAVFAYSEKNNRFVKDAGHTSVPVETFCAEDVMRSAANFDFSWLDRKTIESIFVAQRALIQRTKPDVVLGDAIWTARMAAEANGVTFVSLLNGYMSPYYRLGRPLPPSHPGAIAMQKLPPKIVCAITRFAEKRAFRTVHKPFRAIRKTYRLKRTATLLDELEGDLNILCDWGWLFPQRDLPENYIVYGPLLEPETPGQTALPDTIDSGKPTVCVTMGSTGNWERLRFLSGKAFQRFNIITAGDTQRCITGAHVTAFDFANLSQIFPHCRLLICHGGNGTIAEGLRCRLPMLFVTGHFEQHWNAARIEALKLGVDATKDPERIISDVMRAM